MFDQVRDLIEKGVKVYVLRDYRAIKMARHANGLVKNDENDAVALGMVSPTWFRELTLDRLLLEGDIVRYRRLSKMVSTLKKWRTDGDLSGETAIQLIRQLDAEKNAVGRRIIKRVRSDPFYGELYRRAVEELGFGDRAVAMAVLSVKLLLHLNRSKLKVYLGFTLEAKKTWRYRHDLRGWLARTATAICIKKMKTRNSKVAYRQQLLILEALKRIYREIQRGGSLPAHERHKPRDR